MRIKDFIIFIFIVFDNLYNIVCDVISIDFGNGDWGLGIGDWAQSPIHNPPSPYSYHSFLLNKCLIKLI